MDDAMGMVVPAPVLRRLSSVLTRVTDPTDPATRARSIEEERPRRALLRLPDVPEALMRRPTVEGSEPNPPDATTDSSLVRQQTETTLS